VKSIDPRLAHLHSALRTVGVTGTNGKTTTTSLLAEIVAASGETPAKLTTLGAWVGETHIGEGHDLATFERTMKAAVNAGVRTVAIEMTSQALMRGFARRWPPHVAVLTSFSRDHVDVHGSGEAYLAAKAQLFTGLAEGASAVLDAADPVSALSDECTAPAVTRSWWRTDGRADGAALAAQHIDADLSGVRIALWPSTLADALGGALRLRVAGAVNARNALAAALAADALGYAPAAIAAGLEAFGGVPGRFEIVVDRPLVVVDFAHTPDALTHVLVAARALAAPNAGQLWLVFGCGGARDEGKRPVMGRIADELADRVILTDDNPRGEDPRVIRDAIESGKQGRAPWRVEVDRRRAIEYAVGQARREDVVVVAGRGPEAFQDIGARAIALDDRDVARAAARTTSE
jgi:UDP-N-acetylmuramoyl-L-alanyl-D-glutamate--2,6-diaminopimelate ligase